MTLTKALNKFIPKFIEGLDLFGIEFQTEPKFYILPQNISGKLQNLFTAIMDGDEFVHRTPHGLLGSIRFLLDIEHSIFLIIDVMYNQANGRLALRPTDFALRDIEGNYRRTKNWHHLNNMLNVLKPEE